MGVGRAIWRIQHQHPASSITLVQNRISLGHEKPSWDVQGFQWTDPKSRKPRGRTDGTYCQSLQSIASADSEDKFERLVAPTGGTRSKGFTCWNQFVSMLFCQLAKADSLREICNGLACCLGKLVHLGVDRGPSKSKLSYANATGSAELYEDLLWTMLDRFQPRALAGSQHHFRFKNKLLSLDSTTITLCLSLFPWAEFRRAKGGVKVHVFWTTTITCRPLLIATAKRNDRDPG